MIVRVVKMTFQPDKVEEFLKIFDGSKQLIRNMEGCTHLELWRDLHSTSVFFTYSHWVDEKALNCYRDSALFENVWGRTKVLFSEKPQAWSVERQFVA